MIERYLLRYFLAVVEHGNFTRAADACAVTQPTLSMGISRLEQSVGQALFKRSNRRVELTPAGARLVAHAREIEAQFNRAELDMGTAQVRQTLRLGVLSSLPSSRIAGLAAAVMTGCGVNVELVEGRPRELAEGLASARIDMALTLADEAAPAFRPIYSEGYELALPASHALAGHAEIEAAHLGDSIMIVRRHCEVLAETSRHFTRAGVRPFFSARTTNDERALALVAAGIGLTVMPACFSAEGVVRSRLKGFNFSRVVGLSAPAEAAFADEVLDAARHVLMPAQIKD